MADVTPPVGLAAYAAAAIARADPVHTGFQGFKYEIRTGLLPFIFIFNNALLMIDIGGPGHLALVLASSIVAMAAFVAATQGWFLIRNRWYETLALLLVCLILFRPGLFLDLFAEPYVSRPAADVAAEADRTSAGQQLRMRIATQDVNGDTVQKLVRLELGAGATGAERLAATGLTLDAAGGSIVATQVRLGSQAAKYHIQPGDEILALVLPADRPSPEWLMVPSLALLALVIWLQRRRKTLALFTAA
jgi:Domain of unknown function (DUF3394)/Tripartite ATP-independent periplasmic transporter, DctM component